MRIEKIRELIEIPGHIMTEREIREATEVFAEDAVSELEYVDDFIKFYFSACKERGILSLDNLHLCNQKYIAGVSRRPELRHQYLPYLYLKEIDYYSVVNSFSECIRNINNIIDLDDVPDFCMGACLSKAVDIFMSCGLAREAEKYVGALRVFSNVCDLPPRNLIMIDANLMQAYAAMGKRKEYEAHKRNLSRYSQKDMDEGVISLARLYEMGSEALIDSEFAPDSSYVSEFIDLMESGSFATGLTADLAEVMVPILRWVKDEIEVDTLVKYAMEMIDHSETFANKLDMYKVLINDFKLDKEKYKNVYDGYYHTLLKYYDNACENHRYEVISEMLSYEVEKQYREKAMKDELTGIGNRHAYEAEIEDIQAEMKGGKVPANFTVMAMDVNGLKGVNDNYGHQAGDDYIKGAADCLGKAVGSFGSIFRVGGDEFAAIIRAKNFPIDKVLEILRNNLAEWTDGYGNTLSMAVGYASSNDFPDKALDELMGIADTEMYKDKSRYYQQSGKDRRTR